MLTVASVLWQGPEPFKGRVYGPEHVARLRRQVAEHLALPHRFVCLSNVSALPIREPLRRDWPGWWAKIELFRPRLFKGRVLYLDLDVTVVGDLAPLAAFPAPFVAIKDWEWPTINSSVMAWDAGVADAVHTLYDGRLMKGGDQAWITKCLPNAATFPETWCPSFKHQVRRYLRFSNKLPEETAVIVYHGRPRPWDLPRDHLERLGVAHA